mmetsp:Transcript_54945/g.164571  ORF Transcript_54945/g.164571 Transcript_54945/m.164571 type:complete len:239 (-) Transcript_54945:945-1661(-)
MFILFTRVKLHSQKTTHAHPHASLEHVLLHRDITTSLEVDPLLGTPNLVRADLPGQCLKGQLGVHCAFEGYLDLPLLAPQFRLCIINRGNIRGCNLGVRKEHVRNVLGTHPPRDAVHDESVVRLSVVVHFRPLAPMATIAPAPATATIAPAPVTATGTLSPGGPPPLVIASAFLPRHTLHLINVPPPRDPRVETHESHPRIIHRAMRLRHAVTCEGLAQILQSGGVPPLRLPLDTEEE